MRRNSVASAKEIPIFVSASIESYFIVSSFAFSFGTIATNSKSAVTGTLGISRIPGVLVKRHSPTAFELIAGKGVFDCLLPSSKRRALIYGAPIIEFCPVYQEETAGRFAYLEPMEKRE